MGWRRLPGRRRCNPPFLPRHQAMPVDQVCSTQCKQRLPNRGDGCPGGGAGAADRPAAAQGNRPSSARPCSVSQAFHALRLPVQAVLCSEQGPSERTPAPALAPCLQAAKSGCSVPPSLPKRRPAPAGRCCGARQQGFGPAAPCWPPAGAMAAHNQGWRCCRAARHAGDPGRLCRAAPRPGGGGAPFACPAQPA